MASKDNLVPEGYRPIAVRDDRQGKTIISYNMNIQRFYFVVNGSAAGPFTINDLRALNANIKDVIDLKGRFIYIEEYDASGNVKGV